MKAKKIVLLNILLFFILTISFYAQAQETAEPKKAIPATEDSFFPEFKSEDDMKPLVAERQPFSISYGGWIESVMIDDRSGNDSGTTRLTSSVSIGKLWLKTALPHNSYIYLRGRDIFTYYTEKPKDAGLDTSNNEPDLDAGFFSIANENNTMRVYIGRKFFLLGTGLIFNGRGDGGEFEFFSRYIDAAIFGAYTGLLNKATNPYRFESPEFTDKGKRIFAGGTLSKTIYNQTLYLLGLYQTDKNDDAANAKSKYNSQYYGLGMKGIFRDAFYYGEFIVEQGKSYTDFANAANEKKDINAKAGILGVNYYFNTMFMPALLLDYAYGSGDSDRDVADSPVGNIKGEDNGFRYYGTFQGGYSLRPYLSNIHVYRAGFAVTPFYNLKSLLLKRINIIAKYSNYQKDRSNAPINAGEAVKGEEGAKNKKDIGHGIDLSLRWKIFSDLSAYVNYGMFIPGGAYDSGEKNRTFVMGGIYLSF